MNILENKDILLRALEPSDVERLFEWENNAELWHLSNTLTPFSKYILTKYIENSHLDIFEAKQLRLIIELKSEKRAIGAIDLFDFDPFHKRAGIGILIHHISDRNNGFATQALDTLINYCFYILQLHQIYCNIAIDNQASLQLFLKHDFTIVGEKKDWIKSANGFIDEYLLQLINPK